MCIMQIIQKVFKLPFISKNNSREKVIEDFKKILKESKFYIESNDNMKNRF